MRVTLEDVKVTAVDMERIPRANVRVSRAEFAALWEAAERLCDEQASRGVTDWYTAGVAVTCEWLATATIRPESGPWRQAHSPVTGRTERAYEELIEAELLEAELLDMRRPRPAWLEARPGWLEAICATLKWAWRRSGPSPLRLDEATTA